MTAQVLQLPNDRRVTRPVLRWFGGKWRLAPWICDHLPRHRVYVEPYGGAASVLLRKARSYAEVYNDLDADVVNLFRVLRSDRAADLIRLVELTPFARDEFEASYLPSDDPVEAARRLIARSFMGFGSTASNAGSRTGFRPACNRAGTTPAHDWADYPPALAAIVERLRGVVIENRPALDVMAQQDGPETLHYVDPPYVHATRGKARKQSGRPYNVYVHEMEDAEHEAMIDALLNLEGMVVLSGYDCPLYQRRLAGWTRVDRAARADAALARVESIWISPRAVRQPLLIPHDH